jgi:hypothetical protein
MSEHSVTVRWVRAKDSAETRSHNPDHEWVVSDDARLVEEVAAWARWKGARQLRVWATEHNLRAIRFYRHACFKETEEWQPYKPDPSKHEILLSWDLHVSLLSATSPARC